MNRAFNKYILPSFAGMCSGATLMYMEMDIHYREERQKYYALKEELARMRPLPLEPPVPQVHQGQSPQSS